MNQDTYLVVPPKLEIHHLVIGQIIDKKLSIILTLFDKTLIRLYIYNIFRGMSSKKYSSEIYFLNFPAIFHRDVVGEYEGVVTLSRTQYASKGKE